jgi:hypothetical protein
MKRNENEPNDKAFERLKEFNQQRAVVPPQDENINESVSPDQESVSPDQTNEAEEHKQNAAQNRSNDDTCEPPKQNNQ